jgi:hypothetical protein
MQKEILFHYTEGEGEERVDFDGKVVMKRLNYGERNQLEQESADIKVYGSEPIVNVSVQNMKEISLLKSIVSSELVRTTYQPEQGGTFKAIGVGYPLDITHIKELPMEIGEELFAQFTKLNNLSKKKDGS